MLLSVSVADCLPVALIVLLKRTRVVALAVGGITAVMHGGEGAGELAAGSSLFRLLVCKSRVPVCESGVFYKHSIVSCRVEVN